MPPLTIYIRIYSDASKIEHAEWRFILGIE